MEINKENSKYILAKFAKGLNSLFPGVIIMDMIFGIGIFSTIPDTIYSFLLYMFWCIILSIPYGSYVHPILDNFTQHSLKIHCEKKGLTNDQMKKIYNSMSDEEEEEFENIEQQLLLFFIILEGILTYILFSLLDYFNLNYEILGMSSKYWQTVIVIGIVQIIAYPFSYIIGRISLYRFEKVLNNEFFS